MSRALRIAILAHSTNPRGGVVHALELADALTRLGHEATAHAPAGVGSDGVAAEPEPGLGEGPVLLAGVTGPTRRDDVLPGVLPTAGAGDDVVDVLSGVVAVLAAVPVPREHGAP